MKTHVVGDSVESIVLATDPVRVLRFGASTHNTHRIHYDALYSHTEGLEGPVVMAQLQGTLFYRVAERAAGASGRVTSLSWRNRSPAVVGSVLTVSGQVVDVEGDIVTIEMEEHDDGGTLCAIGSAVVFSPAMMPNQDA